MRVTRDVTCYSEPYQTPVVVDTHQTTCWLRVTITEDETVTVFLEPAQLLVLAAACQRVVGEWQAANGALPVPDEPDEDEEEAEPEITGWMEG